MIGAGPAGVMAAIRAAELGARTTLVACGEFGGMAANDGPVPVRTLAQAARLMRGARQLGRFGISTGAPSLDYSRLLERVREVVAEVRRRSSFRTDIDRFGVRLLEHAGKARFIDDHTIEVESGERIRSSHVVLCAGGMARRLTVPGAELTATHSDAWSLARVPRSIMVIGAGMTGAQVASIFHAFGCRIHLYQRAKRILPGEDADVSAAVADAFRNSGIDVHEDFGDIDSFEPVGDGVRMNFSRGGIMDSDEAELIVSAIGWVADTVGLNLSAAGVRTNDRGYVAVDECLRTSTSHVYAAGDITGRWMLVPQAIQDGWVAATNAVRGSAIAPDNRVCPTGGFTDPEYASVGLTEARARETHDAIASVVHFDATTRTLIDDRTAGFCKLLVDRNTHLLLGCHVVGERAVEIVQIAAMAMSSGSRIEDLVRIPLSYPTYTGIFTRAAYRAAERLGLTERWVPT